MTRTKLHRKKSSIVKKGKSSVRQISLSAESLHSSTSSVSQDSEFLNSLKTTEYESPAHFHEAFEAYYQKKVDDKVKKYEIFVKYVKDLISNTLKSYPESYINGNINIRYDEGVLQELNIVPNVEIPITTQWSGHQSRRQTNNKEPLEFKKPMTPRKTSSRRTSRKRSLSAPVPAAPLPPRPEFKTPLNSARQQMAMIKTITPKVSNTPVSVMRRPQHGEVAFSTSGSPLLIGAVSREDIPTVSVPLQDGRVFSILPDPGLPPPDLPDFDEETRRYLKTLREHLAMLSSP